MHRVYLLAYPAGHSLSPAMHNAAFAALQLPARYALRETPATALAHQLQQLRHAEVMGANISIPHKQTVIPYLDVVSEAATRIGAVNTICNHGGRLIGDNTDAAGFASALQALALELTGARVLVLGAGGAARAVLYALSRLPIAEIMLHNRTREKARALARLYPKVTAVEDTCIAKQCQLIINTTAVGMQGHSGQGLSPLPAHHLPETGTVCDLIYRPSKTPLLHQAETRGLTIQNGLPMLLHQGAHAFTQWTGQPAPLAVMAHALAKYA